MDERILGNRPQQSAGAFTQLGNGSGETPVRNVVQAEQIMPVGTEQLRKFNLALEKYKAGKHSLEDRVVSAERWWKLRNSFEERKYTDSLKGGLDTNSAWTHNVINSKHADYLEAYPAPNVRPREEGDKLEAWALTKIIPVILKQNDFETTYDMNGWQKLKTGTAVYKIIWDKKKLNGLGDISIVRRDLLSVFWEPGVNDIQDSKYFFDVEMVDKDALKEEFPQLTDKTLASVITPTKMPADDHVSYDEKVAVIEVYYKKNGKLHYCKYVGETLLYATENDTEPYKQEAQPMQIGVDDLGQPIMGEQIINHTRAEEGLYEHGMYPYVFDALFPIEGSPAGYGYVDICAPSQTRIDLLDRAILKNALVGATPRYFERTEGAINEDEFLDLEKTIVHVQGTLDDISIRPIEYSALPGNYIGVLNATIDELRQTSGNTETSTGNTANGVTAASALAALQEAAGKTSKASTRATYKAFAKICDFAIELIRQFYDLPRQFRITGNMGMERYIEFQNSYMQPQWQGMVGGVDLGYRKPVYDVEVVPEKKSSYTKVAQNELALQLYSAGMFVPNNAGPALLCLGMMDFDGKEELMQQIQQSAQLYQMQQMQMLAVAQQKAQEEQAMDNVSPDDNRPGGKAPKKVDLSEDTGENKQVQNARERAQTASQPGGSAA